MSQMYGGKWINPIPPYPDWRIFGTGPVGSSAKSAASMPSTSSSPPTASSPASMGNNETLQQALARWLALACELSEHQAIDGATKPISNRVRPFAGGREYACTIEDFGQGPGITILPVSRITGKVTPARNDEPSTIHDIITKGFEEDLNLLLTNYVEMEPDELRRLRRFRDADQFQVLECTYVRTESAICQPAAETVVDMIVNASIKGTIVGGRCAESDSIGKVFVDDAARSSNTTAQYGTAGQYVTNGQCGTAGPEKKSAVANVNFRIRYILDLRQCAKRCTGPIISIYDLPSVDPVFRKGMIRTNQYLLPIMYNTDYQRVALDMLTTYYPEAVQDGMLKKDLVVDGDELARRMGLKVEVVRFADRGIRGQIYFAAGTALVEGDFSMKYTINVAPRTILISVDECSSPGRRNGTILHECCHFYLDKTFFMLQGLTGKPYQSHVSRRRKQNRHYDRKTRLTGWSYRQRSFRRSC